MKKKLKTENLRPPIPITDYDWCAWVDGDEESGRYGWGKTETEAIQDWYDQYDEEGSCSM